ncbi:MAG: phosphate acyltransferase PlsX [Evtepia sp.]
MKIIVDAMGGDCAPNAPVQGALDARKEYGVDIILVGRAEVILGEMEKLGIRELPAGVEIAHAEEVVTMEDPPATAFKTKPDSSLTVGLHLLRDGRGDAFVSAGSTGALLSAATLVIKRIKGIRRAAMAPVLPTGEGGTILIDCGATAECTPEYLLQYAFMGSYYAKQCLSKVKPRVGLLNIGEEAGKGTTLHREANVLLRQADEAGQIFFVGNVEPQAAITGTVDVVVSDGFSGNIFLKAYEGTALYLSHALKLMFKKNFGSKLAAMLVMGDIQKLKQQMDPSEVGGTALLGISKPVIKAHGASNAYALQNAIRQAKQFAESNLIEDITQNVDQMRIPIAHDGGEK